MLRNELLDQGYDFKLVEPKKTVINFIWAALTIIFMTPVLLIYLAIYSDALGDLPLPYIDFHAAVINIMFVAAPVIYLVLKEVLTTLFCFDKNRDIKMKLHSGTDMPINAQREAFKSWQIITAHIIPAVIIYPVLFIISMMSGANINLLILFFIMSFLMSFDYTLVIYILFIKIRYNAKYIAANKHIYSLTLYSKKHIQPEKSERRVKNKSFRFPGMPRLSISPKVKKICGSVILAGLLFSFVIYYFVLNKYEEVIKINIFASSHDTAAMNYTGSERLAGGNIIYCGDNDSLIYSDSKKDSVMRLDAAGSTERLCINEYCRNNLDEYCGHMPDFISAGSYSDGGLYGVQSYASTNNKDREILISYVVRYDIALNRIDKLAEFETKDESTHIRDIFIYSHYLYATVFSYYDVYDALGNYDLEASLATSSNMTVARLNLAAKTASILYSDKKNPHNQDKIGKLIYSRNNIFSAVPPEPIRLLLPANGTIYHFDSELDKFSTSIDLGYYTIQDPDEHVVWYIPILARQIDIYNDHIYYTVDIGSALYRYNVKTNQEEALVYSVFNFSIEDDWLYYGKNNVIYRVKLDDYYYIDSVNDIPYIDFNNATAIYNPEPGCFLGDWSVKDGNLYVVLYEYGNKNLRRININSNAVTHIFW